MSSTPKLRLAILDDYQHVTLKYANWDPIKDRVDITVFDDTIQASTALDALIARLEPFDIICSTRERTKFREDVLKRLPNLKLLTTTANKNAAIDMDYSRKEGIIVSGTAYHPELTVEHNWMLIMATVRRLVRDHNALANGDPRWQTQVAGSLKGHTLGILGLGLLGKFTAELAKAFGMKVQAWSPNLTAERAAEAGVTFVASKAEFFRTSDVITVLIVQAPSTIDLVTYADLSIMKPTAHIVNVSRGPIINQKDLLRALEEEKIAGAALDVFDVEPMPLDHPLRKAKNVTLTPHTGYVSDDVYKVWWSTTAENVAAFLNRKPENVMNGLEYPASRAARTLSQ